MRALTFVPVLLFLLLVIVFGVSLFNSDSNSELPLVGEPAPAFSADVLTTSDGSLEKLTNNAFGKYPVSVVNFWASWCPPCHAEHPQLMTLTDYPDVGMIGINYKDDAEKAKKMLQDLGNPFDSVGFDAQGRVGVGWGITGVPETFLVSREGTILYRLQGPITANVLSEEILPRVDGAQRDGPD